MRGIQVAKYIRMANGSMFSYPGEKGDWLDIGVAGQHVYLAAYADDRGALARPEFTLDVVDNIIAALHKAKEKVQKARDFKVEDKQEAPVEGPDKEVKTTKPKTAKPTKPAPKASK